MKKAIAILLALALVGGAVFAQDDAPKAAFAGLVVADITLDADGVTFAPYNEFTFSWADKVMGVNGTFIIAEDGLDFDADDTNDVTSTFWIANGFRNYSMYVKFAEMIKLTVGKVRISDYRITPYVWNNLGDSSFQGRLTGDNLVLQLYGVKDLSIGAAMPLTTTMTEYVDFLQATDFFVSYNVASVGKFFVTAKNISLDNRTLFVGANITAVENLTAKLGYNYATDTNKIGLTVGYDMAPMSFGLDAEVTLETGADMAYMAEGLFGYAVNDTLTAQIMAYYDSDETLTITPKAIYALSAGEISLAPAITVAGGETTFAALLEFVLFY